MITLQDVKAFFEKPSDEAKAFLAEIKKPTPDILNAFVETEDGKKWLQPKLDYNFTKGLETYRTKTLPGLVEEGIRKAYPAETEDQKKLRMLESELATERKARTRESLRAQATRDLSSKGIDASLADFVLGETIEDTNANVIKLNEAWDKALQVSVEKKLASGGRLPQNNTLDLKTIDDRIKVAEAGKDVRESIRLKNEKFFTQK